MAKKKKKKSLYRSYIKSILPPYTKKDFLPVAISVIAIATFVLVIRPVLAQVADTTPPSQPTWNGMNGPIAPFLHLEQGTAHLHWTASTDNVGVVGYRIYKGDSWTNVSSLAATTTTTYYADFNGGGRNFYQIEAFDASGNVSKSIVESTYLPEDWAGCNCPNSAVISGWITNQQTGEYVTGYIDFDVTNGRVKNIPAVKLYYHNYANKGFYQQILKEIVTDGTYQVTLRANGYQTVTKDITVKAGRSLETYWQLTPAVKKGR